MDLANLTINDGQAAPVATTFVPGERSNTLVVWHDNDPVIAQRSTVSVSRRLPTPGNGNHKYSVRVKVPAAALDPDTGKPVHYSTAIVDFIVPEAATQAERDDLVAFAENALTAGSLGTLVEDGDFIF